MSPSWNDLTDIQRAGMTREFWDRLKPVEQEALANPECIEAGCANPRWAVAGSFRCEEHTKRYSGEQEEAAKLA